MFEGQSPRAMEAWRKLEEITGGGLKVNSAHRSPEHNHKVGGAKNSQHTHGNAFDIAAGHMSDQEKLSLAQSARQAGFTGFGFYDNALHFDVGPERMWGPDYSRGSVPEYARNFLSGGSQPVASQPTQTAGGPPTVDRNVLAAMMPRQKLPRLDVRNYLV